MESCRSRKGNRMEKLIDGIASPELTEEYLEFGRVMVEFDGVYRTAATRMGMSDSAFQALLALVELGEGCTQHQICGFACMGKQTINTAVHKLQDQGIVELKHIEGSRGVGVFLTDAGRSYVMERVMPVAMADMAALESIDPKARKQVLDFNRAYVDALKAKLAEIDFPDARER